MMTEDARFEDGGVAPLRIKAMTAEDVPILSALIQDSIFPISEMKWNSNSRRFAVLLNRFRWEDSEAARSQSREFERVQSILAVEDVSKVASQGIDRREKQTILSILKISFEAQQDCSGRIEITLAGDGTIALDVEALEITLRDVTRPYLAPSRKVPEHRG